MFWKISNFFLLRRTTKENRHHYWSNTWRRLERNERETGMLSSRIFATTLILCKQNCQLIVHYFRYPHCYGPTSLRLFLRYPLLAIFQIERHIKTYINFIMVKNISPLTVIGEVSGSIGWGTSCPGRLALLSSLVIQMQVLGHKFFLPNSIQFIIH